MIDDYTKQIELIKINKFNERINIIGIGAMGSWLAFFLLKMGFKNIHVYDFDTIEEHNLPNQLFGENQIGEPKVTALEGLYLSFFNDIEDGYNSRLTIHNEKLDEDSDPLTGVIFSCVDSMASRKELYESLFKYNALTPLWIEGRLSLYGAYIYSVEQGHFEQYSKYEETLYDDAETEVSACGTSQTALPSAVNCASLMVMQMIQWHNDGHLDLNAIEYSIPWLQSFTKRWKE